MYFGVFTEIYMKSKFLKIYQSFERKAWSVKMVIFLIIFSTLQWENIDFEGVYRNLH